MPSWMRWHTIVGRGDCLGLSINWGPWADVGMAAKLSLAGQGLEKIDVETGLQVFAELLESAPGSSPSRRRASSASIGRRFGSDCPRTPPRRSSACSSGRRRNPSTGATDDFLRRFQADQRTTNARRLLEGYIHGQLLQALGQDASKEIAPTQPWQGLGMDSLMMVEMKNRLERSLRVTIPVETLMQDVNTRVLAAFIAGRLNNGTSADARTGDAADSLSEEDLQKAFDRVTQIPQAFVVAEKQQGRRILADGRWRIDFASCNYLGFDFEPEIMAAIPPALAEWGAHPSWTRAVASPALYDELERELADLVGAPTRSSFRRSRCSISECCRSWPDTTA